MSQNFKYGLYDKSKVTPGYFGKPKASSNDERLAELGLLEQEPVKETGLVSSIKKDLKPGFFEAGFDPIKTAVTEGLPQAGADIFEGVKRVGSDINKIASGTIAEEVRTGEEQGGIEKGILGRVVQKGLEREKKFSERKAQQGNVGQSEIEKKLDIVGQGLGFVGDVFGEGFISALNTLSTEEQKKVAKKAIKDVVESDLGKKGAEAVKQGGEAFKEFESENPRVASQIRNLTNLGLTTLDVAGAGAGGKLGKETIESTGKQIDNLAENVIEIVNNTKLPEISIPEIKIPTIRKDINEIPVELRTEKGLINGVEVEVPLVDRGVAEKITKTFTKEISDKTLAGKAVSPRTIGKNVKQKLNSIANVEKNTKKFYENVRTGVLEGEIGTLEEAAQTMVNNIDTVGARIGEAVKKVDGNIDFDNKITDDIINALNTKGSEVSPATPVLNKFFESLGNGRLTIDEAYELKKAYQNEVTKLYKSGDAGTSQYKALSDGVKFLNKQIDNIIETRLGGEFAKDKELFRSLKLLVDDMVASSLVEGRRSANTLAERIGLIESLFSPVASTKQKLIQSVDDLNTRGGAWSELIKRYDEGAIKNAISK